MGMNESKKTVFQAIRFGIVGVFNTLVDYGFFYIFLAFANFHKSIAQVLATAIAMCGSYLVNRRWTFKRVGRGNFGEIVKFLTVNILSMLVVIFFTHLFFDICHIENIFNAGLSLLKINYVIEGDMAVMVSKACASVFSIILNFFGNKLWVFNSKTENV